MGYCGTRFPVTRIILVLAMLIAGGCGGDSSDTFAPPGDASVTSRDDGAGPSGSGSGSEEWPEGIPDDIPVLDGVDRTLGGGGTMRIFFEGVSESDLAAYLAELDDAGFDLEFIVYASDVNPERAEERAAAGEWDAVRAYKGSYDMLIEFGSNSGSIAISGLPDEAFASDTSWPAAWSNIPPPSGLSIIEVSDWGSGGPVVECAYADDADIHAYVAELEAVGFVVTNRSFNQFDEIISIRVADEANEVLLYTYPDGEVHITVTEPSGEPPGPVVTQDFPDWLPEVPGGDLIFATENPDGGFSATVVIDEGHTVKEYVAVLAEAGFVDTGETMLAGYILSDGERRLTIFGDDDGFTPLQITIQVDP